MGGAKRSKTAQKAAESPAGEWVFCVECDTWVDLKCTPFGTIQEAEAAPPFTCRQCEKITTIQAEMVAMMKEHVERCTSRMDELTAKLDRKIAERRQEGDFLRLLLREEKQEQMAKAKLATVVHATMMAAQAPPRLPNSVHKIPQTDTAEVKDTPTAAIASGSAETTLGKGSEDWKHILHYAAVPLKTEEADSGEAFLMQFQLLRPAGNIEAQV
ncbi:hypothetical protein MTO96_037291 [Rhipicephalus appendiculatus]